MKNLTLALLALALITVAGASADYAMVQDWNVTTATNFNQPFRFTGNSSNTYVGSNFQANSSYTISNITIRLKAFGTPTGNIWIGLYNAPNQSTYTGGLIAVSNNISSSSINTSVNGGVYTFSINATVNSGNFYSIALFSDTPMSAANYFRPGAINVGGSNYKSWYDTNTSPPPDYYDSLGFTYGFITYRDTTNPQVIITVADAYNGTFLTSFNASVTWNGTTTTLSTTNGTILTGAYVNSTLPANITVTPSQSLYFPVTQTFTNYALGPIQVNATPWTAVRAFNFTGGQIQNFSLNYTGPAYTGSTSATNGVAYAPLYNGTYELTVYDANQAGVNYASSSANVTANPYNQSYNFTALYFTNSFLFTFYNETTDLQITNQTVTLQLISTAFAANYTVENGSYNATLLMPAEYQIIYWVDADVPREYYTTLTNQSVQSLRLYTIDEATRALYNPVAQSQYGYACSNQTISLLRYFVNGNAYRVVEMALTDTNGDAVLSVQPNIINYKLQFSGSCGDYTSDPQKITDSTNSFTITDAQSPLLSLEAYNNVARSLTYNTATQTFVFNWADSQNSISQACLVVRKTAQGTETTVNDDCDATSSGSLIYTVNDTNRTSYTATATITLATGESFSDTTSVNYRQTYQTFGTNGLFITALVVILFATLGTGSTETTLLLGTGAIAIMGLFGFIAWNWSYFVGIAVVVGIIIYKVR